MHIISETVLEMNPATDDLERSTMSRNRESHIRSVPK